MQSLLDRSTILAGLVDELRPLLPPLGGALGDLCAGTGRAEAAEQALETAFMIRAAAEMLDLDALAEAGRLIEDVVPLLHEAPPDILKEGLPVVQSLLTAVEQATVALTSGGERPAEALEAARTGVGQLRDLRGTAETATAPVLGLEEMLATLPEAAEPIAEAVEMPSSPTAEQEDQASLSHRAEQAAEPEQIAESELLREPRVEEGEELAALPTVAADEATTEFGEFDLLNYLELTTGEDEAARIEASDLPEHAPGTNGLAIESPVELVTEPVSAEAEEVELAVSVAREQVAGEQAAEAPPAASEADAGLLDEETAPEPIAEQPILAREDEPELEPAPATEEAFAPEPELAAVIDVPADDQRHAEPEIQGDEPAAPAEPAWKPAAAEPTWSPAPPSPAPGKASAPAPPVERSGLFARFIQTLRGQPAPAESRPSPTPRPSVQPRPVEPAAPPERVAAFLAPAEVVSSPAPAVPDEGSAETLQVDLTSLQTLEAEPAFARWEREPITFDEPVPINGAATVDEPPVAAEWLAADIQPEPPTERNGTHTDFSAPEPSSSTEWPQAGASDWFEDDATGAAAPPVEAVAAIDVAPIEAAAVAEIAPIEAAAVAEVAPTETEAAAEVAPIEVETPAEVAPTAAVAVTDATPVEMPEMAWDADVATDAAAPAITAADWSATTVWDEPLALEAAGWSEPVADAPVADEPTVEAWTTPAHAEAEAEAAAAPTELHPSTPDIDPEILEVFMIEAEEVLDGIRRHLSVVQLAPNDRAGAAELRRACHTLKGAANVVGFATIGQACKNMEDLLDALAEAEAHPDEAVLGFLEASYATVYGLVQEPGRADLLAGLAALQAEGQALAMTAGMTSAPASPTVADAAWEQAVEAFLADGAGERGSEPVPAAAPVSFDEPVAPESAPAGAGPEDEVNAELVAVFAAEAEEHLNALSGAALRLDVDPNDGEALAEARRSLHTLKGSAAALGFQVVAGLCHETEGRLEHEDASGAARLLFDAAETIERTLRGLAETGREEPASLPEPLPEATFLPLDVPATVPMPVESGQSETTPVEPEPASHSPTLSLSHAPEEPEEAPASAGSVRVDLGRVDELMNVVGEVVMTRANLEQRLDRIGRSAEELRLTVGRLRRVAQYLEDRYEVAELIRTAPSEPRQGEFDELEMDRYTELHRVSREVAELAADAETTSDELDLALKEIDSLVSRQARLGSDLQDKLMAVRLVPLSSLGTRLHRTARGVALRQGKEVEFAIRGGETELDKRVLEELGDVLLHLIRNAVDHGLEAPAERERLGKPIAGSLTVRAFREGSEATVQVSDDGSGVNLARVRQRAEALGLIGRGQELDDQEVLDLIFQAGMTTSDVASDISGRGVGLDVVRTSVGRLKGSIEVSSTAGAGTIFTLRLPVMLAVVQAMLVKAGEQPYAIPMAALERVVHSDAQPEISLGRVPMVEIEGEAFPYLELSAVLGQPPVPRVAARRPILVVRTGDRRIALAVEALLEQQEIVVKALGPHLRAVRGVLGATIQTSGQVLLVLNTAELLTTRALMLGGRTTRNVLGGRTAAGQLNALVVDDSLSVRKVLARALERDGWEVRQARDGVDALEVLQGYRPNVVLMDIEMPRMDGFELAGILRDVADYGSPPVVMITSRAGDKHRQRASELGVAGYVVKPYQEAELLGMLRQVALAGGRR